MVQAAGQPLVKCFLTEPLLQDHLERHLLQRSGSFIYKFHDSVEICLKLVKHLVF